MTNKQAAKIIALMLEQLPFYRGEEEALRCALVALGGPKTEMEPREPLDLRLDPTPEKNGRVQ